MGKLSAEKLLLKWTTTLNDKPANSAFSVNIYIGGFLRECRLSIGEVDKVANRYREGGKPRDSGWINPQKLHRIPQLRSWFILALNMYDL